MPGGRLTRPRARARAPAQVRAKMVDKKRAEIALKVEEKILDQLVGENSTTNRDSFRALLRQGLLDTRTIDVEVPEPRRTSPLDPSQGGGNSQPMNEIIQRFDKLLQQGGRRAERRQMTIAESRPILEEVFSERVISEEEVKKAALHAVEQEGIVFIDEIDKICSRQEYRGSADASSEGVQRDLLPIIEGSTVQTKVCIQRVCVRSLSAPHIHGVIIQLFYPHVHAQTYITSLC